MVNLPFLGTLDFGLLSIPLTIIWIIGITNAINLIDGLDGLGRRCFYDCTDYISCHGVYHEQCVCFSVSVPF